MIPFQKIFTLVVRTFSKPMLSLMKKKQQQGKFTRFRWFFVTLGRKYQIFQHWLNHRLIKTAHKKQLTQLKQEILLEKGVQAFYQLFFYSIVIGLPMYQLYKAAQSAEKKEGKLKNKIESMQKKLDSANDNLTLLIDHIGKNKQYIKELKDQRQKKIQFFMYQQQLKRNDVQNVVLSNQFQQTNTQNPDQQEIAKDNLDN